MNSLKLIFINLMIPSAITAVFALLVYKMSGVPSSLFSIAPYLLYALTAIVVWVSWHFNRNRFIYVLLPLIFMHLGFEYLDSAHATALYNYGSLFYPIHLLVFLVLKERGFLSVWGMAKVAFFIFELFLVLYLLNFPSITLDSFLNTKIFAISFAPIKDISVIVGVFIAFVMGVLVLLNRYLIYNSSFLVILITFYLALYYIKVPHATETLFLAIGVIVFVILIRESYRLAFYDELTLLPGRRALVEDMAKLGRKYTLAMIDIDHFKKFNDTYGHKTGDDVLKMVASKFANVGGNGKAYRYGGEEFTILFPSRDVHESYIHVDLLRQDIAQTPFVVRSKKKKSSKTIHVNISAGMVENTSEDKDPFAVMKRADEALYRAKKSGRNRVIKA